MKRFSKMRCIVSSNVVYAKIWADPFGSAHIFMLRWDSKERPDRREGKKVSGGHFLSSWASPSNSRRIRYGCGMNLDMHNVEICWYSCTFQKVL